jgi:DNA-binding HxlR family transcriptional regulator
MARATEVIGDRWILLILREAFYGVSRFDDIRAELGVSRALLSVKLQKMVNDGLLEKRRYQDPSERARFEYALTRKGQALGVVLLALMQWSDEHLEGPASPVEIIDRESKKTLNVVLADLDRNVSPLERVRILVVKRRR